MQGSALEAGHPLLFMGTGERGLVDTVPVEECQVGRFNATLLWNEVSKTVSDSL